MVENKAFKKAAKKPVKKGTAKKTVGRPEILNDKLKDEIVEYLKAGAYIETAAACAGISKETFYAWMKRAALCKRKGSWEKAEDKYIAFSDAVKKAIATSEMRDIAIIGEAAITTWQAAAWRLERKHYQRWGRKDIVANPEVLPDETDEAFTILEACTEEELKTLEGIIKKGYEVGKG